GIDADSIRPSPMGLFLGLASQDAPDVHATVRLTSRTAFAVMRCETDVTGLTIAQHRVTDSVWDITVRVRNWYPGPVSGIAIVVTDDPQTSELRLPIDGYLFGRQ
ncbi:MAG: hypothetical protein KAI66_27860, partial [Lentisphaeria bacterium]|nr:hypothetical protein [Lentisphaeria bacterium]